MASKKYWARFRAKEKSCLSCGKLFITTGPRSKYCSIKCKREYYRKNKVYKKRTLDVCQRGHDMSKYRRVHPNGDTYCSMCSNIRTRKWIKENPEKVSLFNKSHKLSKSYGISLDEYCSMLDSQGGVCAICKEKCKSGRRLSVDHDHRTGSIRGLLCSRCNTAIGLLRDNIDLFFRSIDYLVDNVATR